jgi:hypothetical protein
MTIITIKKRFHQLNSYNSIRVEVYNKISKNLQLDKIKYHLKFKILIFS